MNLLIAGGAGTIGRAAAQRLSARAELIIADRDSAAADTLVAELKAQGRKAHAVGLDVTDSAAVSAAFEKIDQINGPIDAFFYAAGIFWSKRAEAITERDWDELMGTHVKGFFLCAKMLLPGMCRRAAGAIVTMASDHAVSGLPASPAYAAAKAALYSLTKSLALEFAFHGIRVNAIGAGAIETPTLRAGRPQDEWQRFKVQRADEVPLGRLGQPEDVAAVLDFLLSERSAYLTGQIIHVNGGELVW
jgi:NAD(P)-dependent dehydrogenase (short-subunit alcohol dehydrogenase family)